MWQLVPYWRTDLTSAARLSRWQSAAPAKAAVTANDAADDSRQKRYLAMCLATRARIFAQPVFNLFSLLFPLCG